VSWRLYVDIGNSAMKFALRRDCEWTPLVRLSWEEACQSDVLPPEAFAAAAVLTELERGGIPKEECDGIVAVTSSMDSGPILELVGKSLGQPVRVLGKDLKAKLRSRYQPPKSLGQDRVANAVAAYALYGGPVAVVDIGSFITSEVVDADGVFIGGCIAAGLEVIEAGMDEVMPGFSDLFRQPAKWDDLPNSTGAGLHAGVLLQMVCTAKALLDATAMAFDGTTTKRVVTGGDAELVAEHLEDVTINPMLTFEGLRLIDGYA